MIRSKRYFLLFHLHNNFLSFNCCIFNSGIEEDVELVDNGDGTHKAKWTPTKEGNYQVVVKYANEEVPRCPFRLRVLPTYDASKVRKII